MPVLVRTQRMKHTDRWWQSGYFRMDEQESAVTDLVPVADSLHFYAKDKAGVSALYWRDDAGVEHEVATGATVITDHGGLTGLGDDDHSIYLLAAGTRALTGDWTTGAFNINIGGGAAANELRFLEPSGSGTNYTGFKAQAQAASLTYTLPAADATVSGYALTSDAAGTLSWGAAGVSDHGALTGLVPDDDHTQYALLAGRTGTNDFTGDIGLTGNLKLPATTATVGQIKSGTNLLLHTFNTNNLFVGIGAGNLTMSALYNTGIGEEALSGLTSGQFNVGVGRQALKAITTGERNVCVGVAAGTNLVGGGSNVAIGTAALSTATAVSSIVAIGDNALANLTTGISNINIGAGNCPLLTTGNYNTIIGTLIGTGAMVGASSNTAIGYAALGALAAADANTAIGRVALLAVTTGAQNTAVGYGAGLTPTTTSNNTFVGYFADASITTPSNSGAFGANATVGQSNHIMLGDSAVCIGLAGAARPTTGSGGLIFPDGTALATMASNTAGLYADDISGNVSMHAINENGDVIKLIKTGTYTPTNVGADRSYDADSTTVDELADVLGTLIADLQLTGLLG